MLYVAEIIEKSNQFVKKGFIYLYIYVILQCERCERHTVWIWMSVFLRSMKVIPTIQFTSDCIRSVDSNIQMDYNHDLNNLFAAIVIGLVVNNAPLFEAAAIYNDMTEVSQA